MRSKAEKTKYQNSLIAPKYKFTDGRVIGCISCKDCNKPRMIYSAQALSKFTQSQREIFEATLTECDFICGDTLFDKSRADHKVFVDQQVQVQRSLTCVDPIELRYYNFLAMAQNKVKRISYLEDVKERNPPCSFCAEPLTNDIVKVFNQLRLKKTRVWPCCSGEACMRLAV